MLMSSVASVRPSSIAQNTSKGMNVRVLTLSLGHSNSLDTGEKPFTCIVCGVSFVRNDLMLRHGRLKHKVNLRRVQPEAQLETFARVSSPPDNTQTPVSVIPDPIEVPSPEIDVCLSALDPALFMPWQSPETQPRTPSMECLPTFTISDIQQLLHGNKFRDVLLVAAQSMSKTPKIPSFSSLNRYVSLFMEKFLPHNPFLPPTFDVEIANPLLLISMASIGALYGMERKTALMLHSIGKNLEENLRRVLGCEAYPLWAIQSLYLNSVISCPILLMKQTFAAWSGSAKGVQYAIGRMPILAMVHEPSRNLTYS